MERRIRAAGSEDSEPPNRGRADHRLYSRPKPLKGWTLIELMVVVAVLMILMGLLFPVFAQARDKARQTVCISHLKQLAAAVLIYCDDNDQFFPLALEHQDDEERLFPMTWMGHLQPYLQSCASLIDAAAGKDWNSSNGLPVSYGYPPSRRTTGEEATLVTAEPFGTAMWEGLGGFSGGPIGQYRESVASHSRSEVARPAETIVLCDHSVFDWGMMAERLYFPSPRHLREPDLQLPHGRTVPRGLINAAFADGHVRALKHEQLWTVLSAYSHRGGPTSDVFRYFWPYE